MANEITVLGGDGGERYSFLFLYPISTPKQVGATNVVVTPAATLPELASAVLTQSEKDALNAGTMAHESVLIARNASLTLAQFQAAVRAEYARRQAAYAAAYTERYRYAGTRFDAVA